MEYITPEDAAMMDKLAGFFLNSNVGNEIGDFMTESIGIGAEDFWYFGDRMIRFKPEMFYKSPNGNLLILNVGKEKLKAFLDYGGFSRISKEKEQYRDKETIRQELEDQKLKYDVKNAKRIYKTYWFTAVAALVGFLNVLFPIKEWASELFELVFKKP